METLSPDERAALRKALRRWNVPTRDLEDVMQEAELALARLALVVPAGRTPDQARAAVVHGVGRQCARWYHHGRRDDPGPMEALGAEGVAPSAEDVVTVGGRWADVDAALIELRRTNPDGAALLTAHYLEEVPAAALAVRWDVNRNTMFTRLRAARLELVALVRRMTAKDGTDSRLRRLVPAAPALRRTA